MLARFDLGMLRATMSGATAGPQMGPLADLLVGSAEQVRIVDFAPELHPG